MADDQLSPGAKLLWENAITAHKKFGHEKIGLNHLIYSILEHHGKMTETIASGLDAAVYKDKVEEKLKVNEIGIEIKPDEIIKNVMDSAKAVGKQSATERDIVRILLKMDGWTIQEQKEFNTSNITFEPENTVETKNQKPLDQTDSTTKFNARAKHKTPVLETYGRDLCQEIINGNWKDILGRDVEIQAIMETLCRWTKRNPLLIGPAGVGKTAIIEGLAQRVVAGEVPPPLQGIRIFAIQPSSIVSGAQFRGKLEERMEAILKEASQDGIVLFIDEIHSIVGSGGQEHISDMGSQLKPALAKGEIACIGATTNEEYHRFIEDDRALERRFQPVKINELSCEATLKILGNLAQRAKTQHDLTFLPEALERIVLIAQQFIRNRNFPDKAIDIFEQTTAHAVINDLKIVTPEIVQRVSQKLIGMPIDLGDQLSERLSEVSKKLTEVAFCPEEIAESIVESLSITTRGLDVNPSQPNLTLLAIGNPGQPPELVAQVLAESLYGDRERLVEVDMSRFIHESDVNYLLGAPPGYVGHDRAIQFHQEMAQQPWSVLHFKDINLSHPKAQQILAQAIQAGYIMTSHGRKVYLSDSTVIFSINIHLKKEKQLGFLPGTDGEMHKERESTMGIRDLIIPDLAEAIDHWCFLSPLTTEKVHAWVNQWIMPPIFDRYKRMGVEMEWKTNLIDWITNQILENQDLNYGEHLLEKEVLPKIAPHLTSKQKVIVEYREDKNIHITFDQGGSDGIQD